MHGISLLVALAAVGVDVGWEQTPAGKLAYTIRIEPVLLDQLRDGSAIQSVVAPDDRGLRRFRVAMGPKSADRQQSASSLAKEVDYGWRPNDKGGMDYYVQLPPDRLETLSKGFPLQCEVHPDVAEIENIFVFVGTAVLPREGGQSRSADREPQQLSGTDRSSTASGGGVAPVANQEPQGNAASSGGAQGGLDNRTRTHVADDRGSTNRQNSTPRAQSRWASEAGRDSAPSSVYGPPSAKEYEAEGSLRPRDDYARFRDDTLPVPDLQHRAQTADRNEYRFDNYRDSRVASRQDSAARQTAPGPAPQQTRQQRSYPAQQTPTQTAQQQPPAQQQAPPQQQQAANAWPQNQLAGSPGYGYGQPQVSLAALPQQAPQPTAAKEAGEDEVKPWTPLILTTLALFASLGANGYLGWLAWSFFWRFRDAASDLSRARTAATTYQSSSVAGR